jgi:DinB family protein
VRNVTQPEVLEELVVRVGRLTPSSERRWGILTPAELLAHLADVGEMALGRRAVAVPARHGWQSRVAKWLILGTDIPFPKGVPTRAMLDPRREGTRPGEFERDRARVIAGLRELATRKGAEPGPTHGRFGPMTMADWQRQGFRHTDHHLKQFGL